MDVPPRSPALSRHLLISFDIDCGELVRGHRFIARGLSDDGTLRLHNGGVCRLFSLEYELVPGVTADEAQEPSAFFQFIVGITYSADTPIPWEPVDSGALAPFEGGGSTHGTRGSYPLPRDARFLSFQLHEADASPMAASFGTLVVDMLERRAQWVPDGVRIP